ncbi:hypothetical protein ABB37_04477 [Leptomonas pyrrhocoris]|uniref:Transmembrane protein n=1 Tax=Leptomonas pyrrhocoris TaxID=157538 RepID=A0A0N0VFJ2_LEPPY|nr:hypothetical protein ABB37_04477 [Leptomonas pyrrhocoris]KPA81128.1 hypothetical protein ABB37_04477 [Leptomonas pyrrhocoris]|eukprot:XP_015659567.1 hypothetical protein ABB37_04477 [Leptomonas pyrrhocoris]
MSTTNVSPFHSSSECPTAQISRCNLDVDELDSNVHSTASLQPRTPAGDNETRITPLDSDAFASPMTRPPTGVSISVTPSPTTARGAQRPVSQRPPGLSMLSPSTLSASSASEKAVTAGVTFPSHQEVQSTPHNLTQANEPIGTLDHHHGDGSDNTLRGLLSALPACSTPRKDAATKAPSTSTSTCTSYATPNSAAATPNTRRRALSSPMVPTTRGFGGVGVRWAPGGEAAAAAGTTTKGDAPRARPCLPPLRPPTSYLAAGSKSGSSHVSRRNGSSCVGSPISQSELQAPLSSSQVSLPPRLLTPATVTMTHTADDNGWWAAAQRYVASKGDQVNSYLERLVNPGAVNLVTTHARTAAAQARSRRASQSFRSLSRHASSNSLSEGGGRHSRTVSVSSGFDGAFNPDSRAPPSRPPVSPAHGGGGGGTHRSSFEPFSIASQHDSDAIPLDVVVIDPAQEPFLWNDPSIQAPEVRVESHDAANDSFNNVGDVSGSDVDDAEEEPHAYVVDLLSALRGYLTNPTEPFGHLVAAALASRSAEMPVRGFEIAAAEHNPFLVRMIVDSGTLEVQDAEVQRNVQDTVDELIPVTEGELSPGIYEYLSSFFTMPFVRLSHGQYSLLKRSGFEYVKLMFDHQHVLPDEPFHSILVYESHGMHAFNLAFMVIQFLSVVFCTVTVAVVLTVWMKMDDNNLQSYGFYTLIVFGGGWALYLIFIIYAVRSRQDEQRYEPPANDSDQVFVPSPYVAVMPVIPLFDIMCLARYSMAVKKKRMIVGHNIVACSRLSGAFYAVWFAFPQLITQSYFNNIEVSIDAQYRHRWAYTMLMVAVIAQWSVAIAGYVGFLFAHDSIDGFGFACFNRPRVSHLLEWHNAAAHALYYLTAFLLETNVFLIAANTVNRPNPAVCNAYLNVVLVLSSFSVFYMLVLFLVITLTDAMAVRISFTSIALVAVQVALCVCSEQLQRTECAVYRHYFFRGTFVFGYLSWGAYFSAFLVWLVMIIQWHILRYHKLNLFPRVLWPPTRKDERFAKAKKSDESSAGKDPSSQAAAESQTGTPTM